MAEPTPISVAMNAAEIDGPSVGGRGEVLEHVHEAQHRADDAHRRREAAGLLERRGAGLVARGHAVDLGLEDRVHHLGVGAVDDQLQGVAGEGVLDLAELRVEREQALAAGLVGERRRAGRAARACPAVRPR